MEQANYDNLRKLIENDHLDRALVYLHQFEQVNPRDPHITFLLAETYNRLDDWFESERYYSKTLELDPKNFTAWARLEQVLRGQARYDECRKIVTFLASQLPNVAQPATASLAMLDLVQGRLKEGFKYYEARFGFTHMIKSYGKEFAPRWTGDASLKNKRILLRYEQGLGDAIQFSRYATVLKSMGAKKVTILCKAPLHRLLATIPGCDGVVDAETAAKRKYDYEVMMMSMPTYTGVEKVEDIPGETYLSVNPEDSKVWLDRMCPTGKLKVGLVWAGDHKLGWEAERMNDRRSTKLVQWRPILDNDCDFYSLQKGAPENQLQSFHAAYPIKNLMDQVTDFYDTACIIDNLDLVICVDTSTAHVAGALGKPTWMLSRVEDDWRWMQHRTDSPWYPSMYIYRQTQYAEWRPTLRQVAIDLRNRL